MTDAWTERWNSRYSEPTYAYGENPNLFLEEQLPLVKPGKILFPAEGEGRNAVFAARLGWKVDAFDISNTGKEKAILLAAKNNVTINYAVGELNQLNYQHGSFDAMALIYAHFPAAIKSAYHRQLNLLLRGGGVVIFEAFSKSHLAYNSKDEKVGGPKDLISLFSIEELEQDFSNFEIIQLEERLITLHEGNYHNGTGAVIRFVGRKK